MFYQLAVQRTSSATVYLPSQSNEGKINVQYRMPTNKLVAIDPMLNIATGSFTSTATGKNVSLKLYALKAIHKLTRFLFF